MTPVVLQLETDEGEFTYYGYMYKDNKDGSVHTFGPTMRFTPPAHPTVDFYNDLTLPVTPDFVRFSAACACSRGFFMPSAVLLLGSQPILLLRACDSEQLVQANC